MFLRKAFKDRRDAGQKLASILKEFKDGALRVLALPRGGVPVGFEIAKTLKIPLEVLVVRKIGLPRQSEIGVGAIAEGGIEIFDEEILHRFKISKEDLKEVLYREREELERRIKLYRGERKLLDLKGKAVILVDDGLATGITAKAAVASVKKFNPKKIILAVPIGSDQVVRELKQQTEVVCFKTPIDLKSISSWFEDFSQTSDGEVIELLKKAEPRV